MVTIKQVIEAAKEFNQSGLGTMKITFLTNKKIESDPLPFVEQFMKAVETIPEEDPIPPSFGEVYEDLVDQYDNNNGFFGKEKEENEMKEEVEEVEEIEEEEVEEKVKSKKVKKAAPTKKVVSKKPEPKKAEVKKAEVKKAAPAKKAEPKKEVKKAVAVKKAEVKKTSPSPSPTPSKAKNKNVITRTVELTKDGRKMWAKGSSAQEIMAAIIASGKNGITKEELLKVKFESENKDGRVMIVTRAAIQRGLVKKENDKLIFVNR